MAAHRIRRQRWMVRLQSTAGVLDFRQQLRDQVENDLPRLFEQVFDESVPRDQTLHLRRLELGVRLESRERLPEMAALICRELRSRLTPLIEKRGSPESDDAPEAGANPKSEAVVNDPGRFQALLVYLKTGLAHWRDTAAVDGTLAPRLRDIAIEESSRLLDHLVGHPEPPAFFFRLLRLLDARARHPFVSEWIRRIAGPLEATWRRWIEALLPSASPEGAQPEPLLALATLLSTAGSRALAEQSQVSASKVNPIPAGSARAPRSVTGPPDGPPSSATPTMPAAQTTVSQRESKHASHLSSSNPAADLTGSPVFKQQRDAILASPIPDSSLDAQTVFPGGPATASGHSIGSLEALLQYLDAGLVTSYGANTLAELQRAARLDAVWEPGSLTRISSTPASTFRFLRLLDRRDVLKLLRAIAERSELFERFIGSQAADRLLRTTSLESLDSEQALVGAILIAIRSRRSREEDPPADRADVIALLERLLGGLEARPSGDAPETTEPCGEPASFDRSVSSHDAAPFEPASGEKSPSNTSVDVADAVEAHPGRSPMPTDQEGHSDTNESESSNERHPRPAESLPPPIADAGPVRVSSRPRRFESPPAHIEFPLRVESAGLILLHPFLSKFFESTGVKESDAPGLSEECVPRAAALLHFLATGERDIHEFDLPFVKVLLGLEPVTPLCVEPGLIQASDEAASSHLLETVIGYWSVLRQTSVPGFRTAFLRRQGLLLADEAGWRLRVERRGHDLLLDYLPWGIGMVKLSWLQKAISTEW